MKVLEMLSKYAQVNVQFNFNYKSGPMEIICENGGYYFNIMTIFQKKNKKAFIK